MPTLGYRSYFTVQGREHAIQESLKQLRLWLESRGLDPSELDSGEQVELGEGVVGELRWFPKWDAATTVRARVVESRPTGAWTTELTIHVPKRVEDPPSVLVEVYAPDRMAARDTATPALVSRLLGALEARDGSAVLLDQPGRVVGVARAEEIAEVICDADRRGMLFVAGSSKLLPDKEWYGYVRNLVSGSHGLAASYFMDPTATRALEEILGSSHAVPPGALRAYRPEADPASDLDMFRHAVLSTEQIASSDPDLLERTLTVVARDLALGSELPETMAQFGAWVRGECDKSLLATLAQGADGESAKPAVPELTLAPEPAGGEPNVAAMVRAVLGITAKPDEATLAEIERLALLGRQAAASEARVKRELDKRQARIDELDAELRRTAKRLEDEQLEHYDAFEQVRLLEERLAGLPVTDVPAVRTEVAPERPAGPGVRPMGTVDPEEPPRSFGELIDRIATLPGVEFTGDPIHAIHLAAADPLGLWVIKTWRIVCALSDYALASVDGRCVTGVEGYLQNLPDGCRGYSANKHAPTESDTTQSTPKYRRARLFPVPVATDHRGEALMFAHFRIARSGTLSPRLHYLDDTARTGKVYIGYIGEHLPNKQTN